MYSLDKGNLPPAKTVFDEDDRRGQNIDSYVCGGCITSGGTVRRSIIGPQCSLIAGDKKSTREGT